MSLQCQANFIETKFLLKEKAKVLLIEDDRIMRRMVRAEIGVHCNLLMAENAAHGATLFRIHRPDLVFIDISLPDGSGHNLLKWMLQVNPATFGVMFSAYVDADNVIRSVEIGAKGFVEKPFDASKMLFFIKQCTGS